MTILYFDLEANGLLADLHTIHCLSIRDSEGNDWFYGPDQVEEGVRQLQNHSGILCGHNVIAYDIPALQKIYPWFQPQQEHVVDTLVIGRLLFADFGDEDDIRVRRGVLPKALRGSMSLEAWGYRLGNHKGDFKGPWDTYTEEMGTYCHQDTHVTKDLHDYLFSFEMDERAVQLEHQVQWIIQRQIRRGVAFDTAEAEKLLLVLRTERELVIQDLKTTFPPIYVNDGEFIPKANNARMGYTGGVPLTKVSVQEFNPGSRDQIADRLNRLYKWEPREDQLTPTGKPKIDEDVLKSLPFPEVPLLLKFLMVEKRIGQLADGQAAWLKNVVNGRIHGSVNSNGAVTGRMTHSSPNLAQVPASGSPYGHECRALFKPSKGYKLVGCDADGLELRCLSHYLFPFDKGAYAKAVDEGKKEDGTDIHTLNQKAADLPTRDNAKTFIYAWLYGAGDAKIGKIIGKGANAGKRLKDRFLQQIPALGRLKEAVGIATMTKGYLKGIDGRKLHVRSEHAALNTLLQSAGALVMKMGLVVLDKELQGLGMVPGEHYEFVLNIHDEWQIEALDGFINDDTYIPEKVAAVAAWSIAEAGRRFNFKCPLKGNADIGNSWADTH